MSTITLNRDEVIALASALEAAELCVTETLEFLRERRAFLDEAIERPPVHFSVSKVERLRAALRGNGKP